eukprot:54928-Prorocentrum_minimum.AAC.1
MRSSWGPRRARTSPRRAPSPAGVTIDTRVDERVKCEAVGGHAARARLLVERCRLISQRAAVISRGDEPPYDTIGKARPGS